MNQPNRHRTLSRRTTNHNALADFDAAFTDINIAPAAAMGDGRHPHRCQRPPPSLRSLLEHNSVNSVTLTPLVSHSMINSAISVNSASPTLCPPA